MRGLFPQSRDGLQSVTAPLRELLDNERSPPERRDLARLRLSRAAEGSPTLKIWSESAEPERASIDDDARGFSSPVVEMVALLDAESAQKKIASDLLLTGLRPGGIVLVHSSLSSMGHVPGGPETVIRGLERALGPGGTLLLPALSYEHVGRWQPVFDLVRTPSNVGAIPEHFRRRSGTVRSVQPTHSVCGIGPGAADVLGEHHLDETPCGARSPFRKLRDLGGQILFIGCGLRPNTSMHGVEELVEPPYLFGDMVTYRVILADGHETTLRCRHHGFGGWHQRYDRAGPLLSPGREIKTGSVLAAKTHVLESRAFWSRALEALEGDPFYFVERREGQVP